MKAQKIILKLLMILITLSSCSNDDGDDVVIIEGVPEYPMKSLLENGVMTLKNTKVNGAVNFEAGYKFKSFKNGKITALGVRVPNNETYRVTLWNADSEEILKTINITATSGLLSYDDVEAIQVTSGTEYYVAVNTNDYYSFNDNGNEIFPVENEDILVLGYGVTMGVGQYLPPQLVKTSYLGMVDIKFVPNN